MHVGFRARRLAAWIVGGLPEWLILPGALRQWSRAVLIDALPFSAPPLRRGEVVDVQLAPQLLLHKNLTLPRAAQSNLKRAIDLHMRQSLPGGGTKLIWRSAISGRDQSSVQIDVFLLKASLLQEIQGAVTQSGAKLRAVSVAGSAHVPPFLDNRRNTDRARCFWIAATIVLLLALAGLSLGREYRSVSALERRVSELEEHKATFSAQAVALREQLDLENSSFAAISQDVSLFERGFQRLPILLDLTESLTDDTWISELSVAGADLRISGFTKREVTDVMASLRALAWVRSVDLDGPVSFDSFSRRNRFDLALRIKTTAMVQP